MSICLSLRLCQGRVVCISIRHTLRSILQVVQQSPKTHFAVPMRQLLRHLCQAEQCRSHLQAFRASTAEFRHRKQKVQFDVLLTVQHLGTIFVNNQLDVQLFFMYVYFSSLHVSDSHVPIIRRINCINTSGICHSVRMTVWCAGLDETASHPNLHTKRSFSQSDIYQMY
jgi:hypothetical protein